MERKTAGEVIGITESVCPECLRRIAAHKAAAADGVVYQEKHCPEHGDFRTVIWRGEPGYSSWRSGDKIPAAPPVCDTDIRHGCPYDCGLCPGHRQHTCCVLLEVTSRCNLSCPFCFAQSQSGANDPDMRVIAGWYHSLMERGGPFNIQLSGGEPTLRDDLPDIVAMGRSQGFSFIQVNTNGIRLAQDESYVRELRQAGLACAFLQFDGTEDAVYRKLRGADLMEIKQAAIARCAAQGIGVVLVPTLVPGVNTDAIGDILNFAAAHMPAVRGVHFQPVSYFGRYPVAPGDADRITIPEVLRAIEAQTHGRFPAAAFAAPGGEHAHCSFHAHFMRNEQGSFDALAAGSGGCCQPLPAGEGARKARAFVARQWSGAAATESRQSGCGCGADGGETAAGCNEDSKDGTGGLRLDSLDDFLRRMERETLAVSGMAFQDAWNLDLERLRECFIHVVAPDGKLIPFCAYNLTDRQGRSLYRHGSDNG